MGVNLTPVVVRHPTTLSALRGRSVAVDGNLELYQFLSVVRMRDGRPLMDPAGHVTSHLSGLVFRTTRLITDFDIRPVFVFDGPPPALKYAEIEKRREARVKAEREHDAAIAAGDLGTAWSKAVTSTRLTRAMVDDAKTLLTHLGIPWLQAPSEGEAQAAFLAREGSAWATGSKDYDSLLFGAPRLVRFLAVASTEFLPTRGRSRPVPPEVLDIDENLRALGLTREELIDAAILIGTDFNDGVRGVGPVTAVRLLREHHTLSSLPSDVQRSLPDNVDAIHEFFLHPPVASPEQTVPGAFDPERLRKFLCDERDFAASRIESLVQRLSKRRLTGPRLDEFSDAQESIK